MALEEAIGIRGIREHIQAVVTQAPWWLVSAFVHMIVIILLATLTFTTIQAPKRRIVIETPMVELENRTEMPVQKEVLSDDKMLEPGSLLAGAQVESQVAAVIADTQANAPTMFIEAPNAQDLSRMVDKGGGFFPTFGAGGGAGTGMYTAKVGMGRPYDYESVIDTLAEGILKEIQKNDLLVVLLFDESKSLLEDRKIITQKINRVVSDLRKELKPREAARLKWAVVSYSAKPTLWLQPTDNIDEVVQSVKKIKVDDTGIENICAAITFTMKSLGPMGKKMYLVNISDEEGNDARNEKSYLEALAMLQAGKARFFTFGRESQFQQGNAFEWLRDSKGERVGPWFWAQRGIESCQLEFLRADWRWNPYRGSGQVGSGYGCYTLSTLSELTKGIFFILSEVPSAYDEERMDKFRPEWVLPAEYRDRSGKSKVRSTMRKIIDEWAKHAPPGSLWQLDRLREETRDAIAKGEKALKFVEEAIDEMEVLRGRKSGERSAKERWEASFDLLLATLYKLRFNMRDYIAVLRDVQRTGFPKPKPNQKFNVYWIGYSASVKEPRTGQRGMKEWDFARKALDEISVKYDGTPWGATGKYLKNSTVPTYITPGFDIAVTRVRG